MRHIRTLIKGTCEISRASHGVGRQARVDVVDDDDVRVPSRVLGEMGMVGRKFRVTVRWSIGTASGQSFAATTAASNVAAPNRAASVASGRMAPSSPRVARPQASKHTTARTARRRRRVDPLHGPSAAAAGSMRLRSRIDMPARRRRPAWRRRGSDLAGTVLPSFVTRGVTNFSQWVAGYEVTPYANGLGRYSLLLQHACNADALSSDRRN